MSRSGRLMLWTIRCLTMLRLKFEGKRGTKVWDFSSCAQILQRRWCYVVTTWKKPQIVAKFPHCGHLVSHESWQHHVVHLLQNFAIRWKLPQGSTVGTFAANLQLLSTLCCTLHPCMCIVLMSSLLSNDRIQSLSEMANTAVLEGIKSNDNFKTQTKI